MDVTFGARLIFYGIGYFFFYSIKILRENRTAADTKAMKAVFI